MGAHAEVAVVGAGWAGLAAGLALADAGRDVAVLDALPEPGGLARADVAGGYAFARGPQSFLGSSPSIAWLCARAGCEDRLVEARAARRRFIYRAGRLHALPSSPVSFATSSLLSFRGKLRLLAEPFVAGGGAPEGESVRAFFERRIGAEATDALVVPFVSGVHAGDADALEMAAAFRKMASWEREAGSVVRGALASRRAARAAWPAGVARRKGLWSFPGGLQPLADAAASALGPRLRRAATVSALEREPGGWVLHGDGETWRAKAVVLAVPPPAAARLLERASPEAAAHCAAVPMAPVAVVHSGGPLAKRGPDGFGVLIHRSEGLKTLGIIFSSALFPGLAPEGHWLQAAYVGGRLHPRILELADADLVALVKEDTQRVLDFDPDGGVHRVVRHPAGIPQLERGHAGRVTALRGIARQLGSIALAGSWLDGIGLEAAAESGLRAAREVVA